MNLSPDIVAKIQEQCMLEARSKYQSVVQEANSQLAHAQAIIKEQQKDKLELQNLLSVKLHEVCLNVYTCTCDS